MIEYSRNKRKYSESKKQNKCCTKDLVKNIWREEDTAVIVYNKSTWSYGVRTKGTPPGNQTT